MAYGMNKGMGNPGMGMAPEGNEYEGMFGEGDMGGKGEDMDSLFAEDEAAAPQDKVMEALIGAGYNPDPEQLDQIISILETENSGQKPEGMEYSEEGMTTSM